MQWHLLAIYQYVDDQTRKFWMNPPPVNTMAAWQGDGAYPSSKNQGAGLVYSGESRGGSILRTVLV